MLYEDIIEVKERVLLLQNGCKLGLSNTVVMGTTTEKVLLHLDSYILHFLSIVSLLAPKCQHCL